MAPRSNNGPLARRYYLLFVDVCLVRSKLGRFFPTVSWNGTGTERNGTERFLSERFFLVNRWTVQVPLETVHVRTVMEKNRSYFLPTVLNGQER